MAIEEKIRELVKEELESQLKEFREQISSFSARIEKIDREQSNRWNLILSLRKQTIEQLMSEYKRFKGEINPEIEESEEPFEK